MPTQPTATVLAFERTGAAETTQIDPGGGANRTAEHFAPAGIDAPPLPGDLAAVTDGAGTGGTQALGYQDPANTRTALPGEFRAYGRDASGAVVNEIHLQRDGTVKLSNPAGWYFQMTAYGVLTCNCSAIAFTDSAGRQLAMVGDLVVVRVPPLVSATGGPVAPGGAGLPIAAAGQIVSGKSNLTG